jgi:hypothetical protein
MRGKFPESIQKRRKSRAERIHHIPIAFLTAPVIHIVFSLLVGWHDYMPFPVYIPSLAEFFATRIR